MSIVYDPSKLLNKIAPEAKIKNLLSSDLSLKKTALSFVDDIEFLSKKGIKDTALSVVKNYKDRVAQESGTDKKDLKDELQGDPKQLIQRVQNEVVLQIHDQIKTNYHGEFYVWLPSDAEEPDPEHQLNYGKTFQVGVGEMPGDRIGCRCGMEILVKETQLNLE
jgi:hypothetical protein